LHLFRQIITADTNSETSPTAGAEPGRPRPLASAIKALTEPRHSLADAPTAVKNPGLYAIYGDAQAWRELGLGGPCDDRPLYVGKAEDNLIKRDLDTHFGNGQTGRSTVRRSIAAAFRAVRVVAASSSRSASRRTDGQCRMSIFIFFAQRRR
jgi:hypothetical protein